MKIKDYIAHIRKNHHQPNEKYKDSILDSILQEVIKLTPILKRHSESKDT